MNFSNTVREFYVKVNIFYSKTRRKIAHFLSLLPTYFIDGPEHKTSDRSTVISHKLTAGIGEVDYNIASNKTIVVRR